MEEEKYYTPSIEEFCSGLEFRCSYIDDDTFETTWINQVFKLDGSWFNVEKDLQEELNIGRIQVKYLDEEDLEELGFDISPLTATIMGSKIINREVLEDGEWCDGKIIISVRKFLSGAKYPHVTMRKYFINDPNKNYSFPELEIIRKECLFQGFIKNKSELKRLMKQLNIK